MADAITDGSRAEAMTYLVCYTFLFRMPSEALPMVNGCGGDDHGEHSVIYMGTNVIYLKLKPRKTRPHGSLLKRSCWCDLNTNTCFLCVLRDYLGTLGKWCPLFAGFITGSLRIALRNRLRRIGVPNADEYRAHDFRREELARLYVRYCRQANGNRLPSSNF